MKKGIKVLIGVCVFILISVIIANLSENPGESGEKFGSYILPLILVALGIEFGLKQYKKLKKKE